MLQEKNDKVTEKFLTEEYLPLAGGALTGNLAVKGGSLDIFRETTIDEDKPAGIYFQNHQTDGNVTTNASSIKVYDDHDAYPYGQNMVIQSGGNMVIGAGESPNTFYTNELVGNAAERLYLTADADIYFHTGLNTYDNRKTPLILYANGTSSLYPVGSIYITSTNSSPSSYLGGTWTLIDKGFTASSANKTLTSGTHFTINSTNTTSLTAYASWLDHMIVVEINHTNKVALTDSTLELFTLKPAAMGVSAFGHVYSFLLMNDGGNGYAMCSLTAEGVVSSVEVVTKAAKGTITAGNAGVATLYLRPKYNQMLDSFCDKFYWKRTA